MAANEPTEYVSLQGELNRVRGQMVKLLCDLGLQDEINRLTPPRYDPFTRAPYICLKDLDETLMALHRRTKTDPDGDYLRMGVK